MHNIYMSKCHNPCENAAFTEYLIEKKDVEEGILFLYRNTPSIFIGKNGNPWLDCDLLNVKKNNLKLVRKYIGTSSEYLDMGTLGFSLVFSNDSGSRKNILNLLKKLFLKLKINLSFTEENNISANGINVGDYTLETYRDKICIQGKILIDTDVKLAKNYMEYHEKQSNMKRLVDIDKNINYDLIEKYVDEMCEENPEKVDVYKYKYSQLRSLPMFTIDVEAILKKYHRWDWNYKKTPDFTYVLNQETASGDYNIKLDVSAGKIVKCYIDNKNNSDIIAKTIELTVLGEKFAKKNIIAALESISDPRIPQIMRMVAEYEI